MRYNTEELGKRLVRGETMKWAVAVVGIVWANASLAGLSGSLDEQSILERLRPEGRIKVQMSPEGSTGTTASVKRVSSGDPIKERYNQYCRLCHDQGLAGAPKIGKKSDWAPRIAQGIETLVQHSIQGYKAMPPKGTCVDCTDEEMKKLVEYMVSRSK